MTGFSMGQLRTGNKRHRAALLREAVKKAATPDRAADGEAKAAS